MLSPNFADIPAELKQYRQWVNWNAVERDGKITKPPCQPNGSPAKTNDPATWNAFPYVEKASPLFDGVGFVLTQDDDIIGLDFDKCRCPAFDEINPEIASRLILPDIKAYIDKLSSYTEISPSGKGIRVLLRGHLPVDGRRRGPIEAYQNGRYVTLTGHVVDGFPKTIEHRQDELDDFYNSVFGDRPEPPDQSPADPRPVEGDWHNRLDRAFQSKKGTEIKMLWDGDHSGYPSQSEADMALCSSLAFWLDGDAALMDAAFRESGLYREKWDEKHYSGGSTYGQGTIRKAVKSCQSFYGDWSQEGSKNPLDAAVARLAALSPLEYDQARKAEAKALGIRTSTLDASVKAARGGNDNSGSPFAEVEPWPDPVDPEELLSDIASTIRRFIICNEEVSYAVTLWTTMTHFIDAVQVAPLAVITAPEKRCGKTLLLSLIGKLSARAITASSITPAALFRAIERWNPTLLIDEADAFMKDNEELRGILNSGHTRESAYVVRTVGETFVPTKFSTWGAKALCGIGHLPDTLMDRAVVMELRRKLSHEKVERMRQADPGLFDDLRSKLARFAEDYREEVRLARPPLPHSLNDRAQDNWEPLLAIAMVAGSEWLKIGTSAALKLAGTDDVSQTVGVELLADIKEIFEQKRLDRISSVDLVHALSADEEKPWATFNRGQRISPKQIASRLKGYNIYSRSIRIGSDVVKGYEKDQFEDAYFRYCAAPSDFIGYKLQSNDSKDLRGFSSVTETAMLPIENQRHPLPVKDCNSVTDKNPPPDEEKRCWGETSHKGDDLRVELEAAGEYDWLN